LPELSVEEDENPSPKLQPLPEEPLLKSTPPPSVDRPRRGRRFCRR
jgi:hypothetical protein